MSSEEIDKLSFWKKIDLWCKSNNIILRNSNHGIWCCSLLFFSYLQTILRDADTIQLNYEVTTVLIFGMMLQSIEFFLRLTLKQEWLTQPVKIIFKISPSILTTIILHKVIDQEIIFSAITGTLVMIIYYGTFLYTLKSMPKCFTFGEATVIVQGFVVFLYNCFLKLPFIDEIDKLHEQLNVILQIGLLGVLFLVLSTYFIPIIQRWYLFYPSLLFVIFALCFTTIYGQYAVTILWNFIFNDYERIMIVGAYILFLVLAGVTVSWQIQKNTKSTTVIRKAFHILIVAVYIPGLIYQCFFLYVASVVILAIFIVLELARVIKLYPVDEILEKSVQAFIDEKDTGRIALTPLYLLIGCSVPLWIHNSPCDLTDSSSFEFLPLISGVLSIGIGDTFASIIGSMFGKHKWKKNSQKSVEGTISSIFAQSVFIFCLSYMGVIHLNMRLTAICGIAVISNALIEAFTEQIDNLTLPFITYIILAQK